MNSARLSLVIQLLVVGSAFGANPTFSLEVTAINGQKLEKPAKTITVAPEDVLTAKIFVRDWSPHGQKLRGVQATLDDRGYTSGESGTIQPVDFETTTLSELENKENAFVDSSDPKYVFHGGKDLSVVDTMSYGYRFLSVVVAEQHAPVAPQDGTKFAFGTVNLKVSEDARGTFLLGFDDTLGACEMRDLENEPIDPLEFELLVVHVVTEGLPLRLVSSNPPSGAIDARKPVLRGDALVGWDTIELKFNTKAGALTAEDFELEDGTGNPPRIGKLSADGRVLGVHLDPGLRPGTWMTITHRKSQTGARIGCLPGDVDNDGAISRADMLALLDPLETAELPLYQRDIDRNGETGVGDVLCLIALMNAPDIHRSELP